MTGVDYDKMVRTITETVSNQMNIEINSLRARINQLENKLEHEITKRQGLEEEVRRLKENTGSSSSSSLPSSSQNQQETSPSPQVALPKKPSSFVHTNNNVESLTRNIRTFSDVGPHPPNGLHHNNNNNLNKHNTDDAARQAMKSSDDSKSGWVKAPLPREPDGKSEVHDTVLFDTASDRTMREGSLEKMGKTRQSWKVRWFRLQQGNLFYYKSPKDKKPIGEITLQNCSVFRSNSKRAYEFTISVPSRDWLFAARDEEEAEQWVEAVKSCVSTKGTIHYT